MKSPLGSRRLSLIAAVATSSRTSVIFPSLRVGSGGRRLGRRFGGIENRLESAPEHPLAVERHLALWPQALVGHDALPGFVAARLVGPLDKREDDTFAVLGLHRSVEIG